MRSRSIGRKKSATGETPVPTNELTLNLRDSIEDAWNEKDRYGTFEDKEMEGTFVVMVTLDGRD